MMDQASAKRLFDYVYQALDDDNARDMETFAQGFTHNSKVWDAIADHFPDARPSEVRRIMMEAFAAYRKGA